MAVWGIRYSANLMVKYILFGLCLGSVENGFSQYSANILLRNYVKSHVQIAVEKSFLTLTIPDEISTSFTSNGGLFFKKKSTTAISPAATTAKQDIPARTKTLSPTLKKILALLLLQMLGNRSHALNVWSIYLRYSLNYPNMDKYTIHWAFGILIPKEW